MRSSSSSSSATSSLSVKASKTGLSGKKSIAPRDGGGGGRLFILLSSIIAIDTDLRTLLSGAVCLQRSQDSDALPGELCEGAPAERAGGSALQTAAAAGAAH